MEQSVFFTKMREQRLLIWILILKMLQKARQSAIFGAQEGDKPVAEVTMKSDDAKELVLNGLKEDAEVTVTSDNEDAVTAAYADGKVKLTAKSVTGMEKAAVTIESEGRKDNSQCNCNR